MFATKETCRTANRASPTTSLHGPAGETHQERPHPSQIMRRSLGNSFLQSEAETPTAENRTGDATIQRSCSCGGSCASCAGKSEQRKKVQAKPKIGPANDVYEQEAERVADHIMQMGHPSARMAAGQAAPALDIRRRISDDGGASVPEADIDVAQHGGDPLSSATRAFMEPRFGADFGHVRLHSDDRAHAAATRIQARAFTYGSHIWLGKGESEHDGHLMAHELTHVVQQGGTLAAQPDGVIRSCSVVPAIQRAINPTLDKIEALLSYGIFDWRISDAEAEEALRLLQSLPRYEQAIFFTNPKYVDRLRDNLPDARVAELDSLQSAVAPIAPPTATVEDIRSKLSYGLFDWAITDEEAIQALEMLKKLSGTQLATALGAIDYGRLMDNLPDSRKPELVDLLAKSLATGGAKQTEQEQNPGTVLTSITFRSDYGDGGSHGIVKNNDSDWSSSGSFYGKPEWFISDGEIFSFPVAQKMNTKVELDVGLNILPVTAPLAPIRLTGRSDVSALNFDFSGTMHGGQNQKVKLTSTGTLPDKIAAIEDKYITWNMEWRNWKRDIGRTGGHSIFVTIANPPVPDQITLKRMRTAVKLAGAVNTTDPHPLVRGIMRKWGAYNLNIRYQNAWELADNLDEGAQCIDIVRFVNGLLQTVGCPGTALAMIIWANPATPTVAEENLYPHGGGAHVHPSAHPDWGLGLMDANGCPNNFEAALRFDYGGALQYYPGGVSLQEMVGGVLRDKVFATKEDVLFIFQCLAWVTYVGGNNFDIHSIIYTYPHGTCTTGNVHCNS